MATRLPASARTREELRDLIEGRLASSDERSALLRLATRLIVEEASEAEVADALGRGYYARGRGRRRLSQRVPDRPAEDRRGADRVRRAPDREPGRALPLGVARRPAMADRGARGLSGGAVRPRAQPPRHRRCLHR
jgi:hypothetical protein